MDVNFTDAQAYKWNVAIFVFATIFFFLNTHPMKKQTFGALGSWKVDLAHPTFRRPVYYTCKSQ